MGYLPVEDMVIGRLTIARYSAAISDGLREVTRRDRGGIPGRWTKPVAAPQFTVLRRKPSRYRESHLGNCIQPQQVLQAWTEARGKQPEAATRSTGRGSLADMRIAGIDPIVTILSG